MYKQFERVYKILEVKNTNNSNSCENNNLMKLKQLLSQINAILDENDSVITQEIKEEIHADLKKLVLKSVAILL